MDGIDAELVLMCPRCRRRHARALDEDAGVVRVACASCRTAFAAELVRVTDVRSRIERGTGTRRSRVRVSDAAGAERVMRLGSYTHAEFPLAAGEWAVVARVDGHVRAVQDPAGGRFLKIRPGGGERLAWPAQAWAAAAAGAMAVAAVAARVWAE